MNTTDVLVVAVEVHGSRSAEPGSDPDAAHNVLTLR